MVGSSNVLVTEGFQRAVRVRRKVLSLIMIYLADVLTTKDS